LSLVCVFVVIFVVLMSVFCVVLLSCGIGHVCFLVFFFVIFVWLLSGDVLGVLCASCGVFLSFVSLMSFISLSPPSWLTILVLHLLISFHFDLRLFNQRSLSLFGSSVGLWAVP
jgi:hypothetical protein